MRHRRPKRHRYRSNHRGHQPRMNGGEHLRLHSQGFSNGRSRNNFKPQQSAEKLFEKYSTLAKEALSSGDKILSENYFQHADHFMRIIDNKKLNQAQNLVNSETNISQKNDSNLSQKKDNVTEPAKPSEEKKDIKT